MQVSHHHIYGRHVSEMSPWHQIARSQMIGVLESVFDVSCDLVFLFLLEDLVSKVVSVCIEI